MSFEEKIKLAVHMAEYHLGNAAHSEEDYKKAVTDMFELIQKLKKDHDESF